MEINYADMLLNSPESHTGMSSELKTYVNPSMCAHVGMVQP